MTQNEKILNFWREINGLPKASREDLQSARARNVEPILCGQNKWTCASTSRRDLFEALRKHASDGGITFFGSTDFRAETTKARF